MLLTILSLLVVLGVLIFVHELGHFLAAKWAGIYVHRFSIGVGAPIKALSFKRGETEYALSWLPLGGYVRMASKEEEATSTALEGGAEELPPVPADRMFEAKPVWKRVIVILAGVTMNILFAWFLFSFLAARNGRPVNPVTTVGNIDTTLLPAAASAALALKPGDRITAINGEPVRSWTDIEQAIQHASGDNLDFALADGRTVRVPVHADAIEERLTMSVAIEPFTAPVTGRVFPGKPAARAGMQTGDTIVAVDGREVWQWNEVLRALEEAPGRDLRLTVGRPAGRTDVTVRPDSTEVTDSTGTRWVGKIGVEVYRGTSYEPYPSLWAAIQAGGRQTIGASTTIFRTVRGMVSGRVSSKNVGGPIAIGQMAGETARLGLDAFLSFMALISVNLAVLNLLPIPVLDGGQLVFLLAEGALRRPLPLKLREKLTLLGLAVVVTLMALAFWNDIRRLLEAFSR